MQKTLLGKKRSGNRLFVGWVKGRRRWPRNVSPDRRLLLSFSMLKRTIEMAKRKKKVKRDEIGDGTKT